MPTEIWFTLTTYQKLYKVKYTKAHDLDEKALKT